MLNVNRFQGGDKVYLITFNGQIECKKAFLNIGFTRSDQLVEPVFKRAFFMVEINECAKECIVNQELLLAEDYKIGTGIDVYEYIVTEKYDGVHAVWNGTTFINKQGHAINAPDWFTIELRSLRGYMLVGELWAGRGNFHAASATVSRIDPSDDEWKKMTYIIFDVLDSDEKILKISRSKAANYETRLRFLHWIDARSFPSFPRHTPYFKIVDRLYPSGERSLLRFFAGIVTRGGEGLMLRKEDSMHPTGRSHDILKLTTSNIKCEALNGI